MSLPEIRVLRSASQVSPDRSAGSSTNEWSGRMSIRPKSLRPRPPSFASAPTIWRGSTLCRLPTAMRYYAIGPPLPEREGRGLRGPRSRAGGGACFGS